jgi:predicted dehydrogenase
MDMGCHSIAYCRWVFGNAPVESVYAEAGNFVHQGRTRGDDHAVVMIRFAPTKAHPHGGLGVAENSWARIGGLDDRAEIYGSKGLTVADIARGGALHTFSAGGYAYAGEKAAWSHGWTWTSYDEAWQYGFPQEMAHFARCIENGEQPMLTGADGRAVLEIICAAYESARTGQRVKLPLETSSRLPVDYWLKRPDSRPRKGAAPERTPAAGTEPQPSAGEDASADRSPEAAREPREEAAS